MNVETLQKFKCVQRENARLKVLSADCEIEIYAMEEMNGKSCETVRAVLVYDRDEAL